MGSATEPAAGDCRHACAQLVLLLALCESAGAETLDPNWQQIDSPGSSAGFAVKVAWVRQLPGRFDYLEGVIIRQPEQQTLSVDVRLAAQSLWMPNPDHADWAHSAEFFDSQRHPWIRFHAQAVPERLLIDGGSLIGELSLRGHTRPVSFEVEPGACTRPGVDCPVIAHGELQRSEFGMQARRFVVSDKVKLEMTIRVRKSGTTQ